MAGSNATATQQPTKLESSIIAQIIEAEQRIVLECFSKLKERGDGEMRISIKKDRQTGLCEIVYAGVHERADLESIREMYKKLKFRGTTF